ncbi:hypothetical protein BaRGS_00013661 [Batillaria attramentaria]|uniref:Protein kinase domain-containing protein n=1 Tax=Batillaria attramentaria TaxID=370345 RepID=A0ABD0L6Y3_9CAEN
MAGVSHSPKAQQEYLPADAEDRRKSNVRWSKQHSAFTTGHYPDLTWDLYDIDQDKVDLTRSPTPEDFFTIIKQLGYGTFGKVKLVETLATGERLAMKIMDKSKCKRALRVKELRAHILVGPCPFVVRYHSCFKTEHYCYILLQYHHGGSLARLLEETGAFDVATARFYTAEMVEGLLHLHSVGILHRDIKLTNVLLGTDNHVRLCDLGLCKLGMTGSETTHSRVGAPRYCAPEVGVGETTQHVYAVSQQRNLVRNGVKHQSPASPNKRIFSSPPDHIEFVQYAFDSNDREVLLMQILHEQPDYSIIHNKHAVNLIRTWLTKVQCERLGYGDTEEDIRNHPFFYAIEWEDLRGRLTEPPAIYQRFSVRHGSFARKTDPQVAERAEAQKFREKVAAVCVVTLALMLAAIAIVFRDALKSALTLT